MPSREQTHSSDKSTAKRRPPLHEIQDSETVDWLHHPATIVQRAAQAPRSLTPEDVLRLQRTVGNRAVLRLPGVGRPSPEVGAVRAGPLGQRSSGAGSQRTVQRQEEDEEPLQMQPLQRRELDEEEALQAKTDIQRVGVEADPVPPEVESAINRARGGGQPLEPAVQTQMSETMGHDFSGVRVHTDAEADELNTQLQAKAFTTGADIFFKRGAYEPGCSGGRELIAHELSHVVQQSSGSVPGGGDGMTVRPAGDAFEQEADAQAQGVSDHRRESSAYDPTSTGGRELIAQEPMHVAQHRMERVPEAGAGRGMTEAAAGDALSDETDSSRRRRPAALSHTARTTLAADGSVVRGWPREGPRIIQRGKPKWGTPQEKKSWAEFEKELGDDKEKKKLAIEMLGSKKEYAVEHVGQGEYKTSEGLALHTGGAQCCVIVGLAGYDEDGNAKIWGLAHFDSDFKEGTLRAMIGEVQAGSDRLKGWVVGGPDSDGAGRYETWPGHEQTLYKGVIEVMGQNSVDYEAAVSEGAPSGAMRPVPVDGKMKVRFRKV